MTASTTLPFFKMNGIGNSILVVDARDGRTPVTGAMARAITAAGFSYDQIMAIGEARSRGSDAYVTIFNADGTEAGACGNGTRCVAWAMTRNSEARHVVVETVAGPLTCERLAPELFAVDMGPPALGWQDIPLAVPIADPTCIALEAIPGLPAEYRQCFGVSMGNPHAVFFVEDVDAVPLATLGPVIEHHPMFPDRANVSFAQVIDRRMVRLRVWERSAGATLACGSAACATTVAGVRLGLFGRHVGMRLPGGTLQLTWRQSDDHLIMAGPVELEHAGVLPADLVA